MTGNEAPDDVPEDKLERRKNWGKRGEMGGKGAK